MRPVVITTIADDEFHLDTCVIDLDAVPEGASDELRQYVAAVDRVLRKHPDPRSDVRVAVSLEVFQADLEPIRIQRLPIRIVGLVSVFIRDDDPTFEPREDYSSDPES
jgi:hypothetical protein